MIQLLNHLLKPKSTMLENGQTAMNNISESRNHSRSRISCLTSPTCGQFQCIILKRVAVFPRGWGKQEYPGVQLCISACNSIDSRQQTTLQLDLFVTIRGTTMK